MHIKTSRIKLILCKLFGLLYVTCLPRLALAYDWILENQSGTKLSCRSSVKYAKENMLDSVYYNQWILTYTEQGQPTTIPMAMKTFTLNENEGYSLIAEVPAAYTFMEMDLECETVDTFGIDDPQHLKYHARLIHSSDFFKIQTQTRVPPKIKKGIIIISGRIEAECEDSAYLLYYTAKNFNNEYLRSDYNEIFAHIPK